MTDSFTLTINYKGEERGYSARLLLQGYTFRICIHIDEVDVYFERDEEDSFRVVKMPSQDEKKLEKIDKALLLILKEKIEEVLA